MLCHVCSYKLLDSKPVCYKTQHKAENETIYKYLLANRKFNKVLDPTLTLAMRASHPSATITLGALFSPRSI